MPRRTVKKELDSPEAFERALREELSVSADFELPLSVIAIRAGDPRGSFGSEAVRAALEALRVADLICRPGPDELLVALPNTGPDDARLVESRLRKAVAGAAFGVVHRAGDEAPETLLRLARAAAEGGSRE